MTFMSAMSLTRSPLFLATVAIWLSCFAVWTLEGALENQAHQFEIAKRALVCDAIGAMLCGGIYLVLRRLEGRALIVRLSAALALASGATVAFMALLYSAFHIYSPLSPPPANWLMDHMDVGVAILWTFLAWCGVYVSLGLGAALREAEAMALDAQNRMLRYQLDPHFLFNIHSALATLIHDGRNAEAERMVLLLSSFLRRSLEKDPGAQVSLSEELRGMREYMGVEAVRFGSRLRFVEAIEPGVQTALAPSFILQPLLENAIKHGLGESAQSITIELGAAREGLQLRLWVQDDGGGGPARGPMALGLGLQNVERRLEALYGDGASVAVEPRLPRGFKVTLRLPLILA
jgi:two-component system, LytTR family, sensor kinase